MRTAILLALGLAGVYVAYNLITTSAGPIVVPPADIQCPSGYAVVQLIGGAEARCLSPQEIAEAEEWAQRVIGN